MTDRVPEPYWIEEIKREIKRLDNEIRRLESWQGRPMNSIQLIENGKKQEKYKYYTGRRDALKWALKMRDGKSSRKQAWGKEE